MSTLLLIRRVARHTLKSCCTRLNTQAQPPTKKRRSRRFFFGTHLFLTNCITSGVCMALGDLIQQEFEYLSKYIPERYHWERIGRMFAAGVAVGPLHHYFYLYLDRYVKGASIKLVFLKIAIDQFTVSPITYLFFFYIMGIMEMKSVTETTEEFKQKFFYVYLADWLFWPPAQFLNFYLLPTRYRVVYINFLTMLFNIYLSYMKHFDQLEVPSAPR